MEKQDWIEDVIVDVLRTGLETIGQEYIAARMHWIEEAEEQSLVAEAEKNEKTETK